MTNAIAPGDSPPLIERQPPRCPPYHEAKTVEDLLPYLEEVAKRPYNQGIHAAWDLQPGERVCVLVDNWHDSRCIEAVERVIKQHGCEVSFERVDRGPMRRYHGHDEVEVFLEFTKLSAEWMSQWKEFEEKGIYDKLLWGFGGPVLSDAKIKIQRMPFVTPELVATPAHTIPAEILAAVDQWMWDKTVKARHVRITDPEGTDFQFTNRDEYYDAARTQFREDWLDEWVKTTKSFWRTYIPGHVWAKPWFMHPRDDASGVVAGTMNHIGPYPHMRMEVRNAKVMEFGGGGEFGEKLRDLEQRTRKLQYPGHTGPGLMYTWEVAVGTNPKIHRPRTEYLQGWTCGLYERMRSGVIHIGFGTVITTDHEEEAAKAGLPVGHFHVHLYFPTVTMQMVDGGEEVVIEDGRLKALDDPRIREIAAKYGDLDEFLSEDWVPAIPGLNMEGDYWRDYAADPEDWTMTELHICRRYHDLFMKMISPSSGSTHHHHHHH